MTTMFDARGTPAMGHQAGFRDMPAGRWWWLGCGMQYTQYVHILIPMLNRCRAPAAQRDNGDGPSSPVIPPPQLQFKVASLISLSVSREPC